MVFFTSDFKNSLETTTAGLVDKSQYQISSVWYDSTILSSGDDGDYKYFHCEIPTSVAGTITGLRFIDSGGNVIGYKSESIIKNAGQAFTYKIRFRIIDKE